MEQGSENIKFSVIIPVYNGAKTIERTIDSVLSQSYAPHEVIIVDDASTDSTCALLRSRYGDKIKLVEKLKNEGSSAARNYGMDVATGEYVAFLDADDIWHKDKLKVTNAALMKNRGIVLFFHRFTQSDVSATAMPAVVVPDRLPFIKLLPGNFIATSCIVMRNRPEFRFNRTMRYTEDYDLCLRIGYVHGIYYTDLALTRIFRGFTTKGGISGNRWLMRKGEIKAYAGLAKLNPAFVFLVPFLWLNSLVKHIIKNTGILNK